MKKKIIGLVVVLCAVLLGSCGGFFTNSLGENWARDPGTITVSAKNVKALLRDSRGDPKASKGILDKIAEELKNNPDPALQAAAVTAGNQAAGLGDLVLDNIGTVLESVEGGSGEDAFDSLFNNVEKQAKANDIKGVSKSVSGSLIGAVKTDETGKPVLSDEFVATGVSDSDLTLLAFTLILGEAEQNGGFDNYIKKWGDGKSLNGNDGLTESEKVIAAIGNKLATGGTEIGTKLKELLS
jgi:hypothetical protein